MCDEYGGDSYGKYRVRMHSVPGMWERYEGYVDVYAPTENDAPERAKRELRRTSFPDRPASAWAVDSVIRID